MPGDRREVERRDGEDVALERAVLEPVPDAGRGDRLLLVDARHVLDVEAPEVDELARGVDLGLVRGLRLAEHRRGVERLPPRAGEELGGAEEDGGAIRPRRARPVLPRVGGGFDRALDLGAGALVDVGEDVAAAVRHDGFERVAGADLLAADDERDVEALGAHLLEAAPELVALGAAGLVALDRLVDRIGHAEDAVGAHVDDSRIRSRGGDAGGVRDRRLGDGRARRRRTGSSSGTSRLGRGRALLWSHPKPPPTRG